MRLLFSFLFFLICHLCSGQMVLNGYWKGTLTQDEGGVLPEYSIEMYLRVKGPELDSIDGRAIVGFGEHQAEFAVNGRLVAGTFLQLKETKIMRSTDLGPSSSWCIKSFTLFLNSTKDGYLLEGDWNGSTLPDKIVIDGDPPQEFTIESTECIPGKVHLKKSVSRA